MRVLVTGAAGFIGFHVVKALLARGDSVFGIDSLNEYYSLQLKEARLARLEDLPGFEFERHDLADRDAVLSRFTDVSFDAIIHLAAQAGVRYSINHPFDYADANLIGHLTMLEMARHQSALKHMVYASSSSVYGGNEKLPFSESDPVDHPVSLYAATKRANELMSQTYAHLYGIPQTGLRFFTVYGPWGRPDMAYWMFTENILQGKPIPVFNDGKLQRDYTYIDDIVAGVVSVLDGPPQPGKGAPHRIYNIGNNRPEELMDFIRIIEDATGRKADIQMKPMQPGDVLATYADISAIQADFAFEPQTPLAVGLPKFVEWYKSYNGKE